MARGANQKIKILYLMKIMYELTDDSHGLTLNEITEHLANYGIDVERKALYDDLEVLRNFGMDIEMRKDKTVRYYVASRDFELPELKLLVDAVQSSKFITHKKSMELIKKIESFTSRHEAQKLQRQVFVANRIKTMNESIYYTVDYIHEAISNNVQITFQYFDWNEKKEKVLRHDGQKYGYSSFRPSFNHADGGSHASVMRYGQEKTAVSDTAFQFAGEAIIRRALVGMADLRFFQIKVKPAAQGLSERFASGKEAGQRGCRAFAAGQDIFLFGFGEKTAQEPIVL